MAKWKELTTFFMEEVVWKRRYVKTGPQITFVEWSGKGGMEKPDHKLLFVSGPESKIWKNQTTGYFCEVVWKGRYGKTRPQVTFVEWSGK